MRKLDPFDNFLNDMGMRPSDGHSIERNDVNLGYSPENCRWATRTEQNRNTRASRWISCHGETKTLAEWSEVGGVSRTTIIIRLSNGWPVDRAIFEKAFRGKNRRGHQGAV